MSAEPNERDVEALRDALWCAMDLNWTPKTLARAVLASDWYAERIAEARREGAAEAHGIRFRVGTACDGYASLTAADVPEGVFDEEDYYLGAQHAAEGIRAALRGGA